MDKPLCYLCLGRWLAWGSRDWKDPCQNEPTIVKTWASENRPIELENPVNQIVADNRPSHQPSWWYDLKLCVMEVREMSKGVARQLGYWLEGHWWSTFNDWRGTSARLSMRLWFGIRLYTGASKKQYSKLWKSLGSHLLWVWISHLIYQSWNLSTATLSIKSVRLDLLFEKLNISLFALENGPKSLSK